MYLVAGQRRRYVGTADEIRGLLDLPDSMEISLDKELLCVLCEPGRLFILRSREVEELKAIVRQGRFSDVAEKTIAADVIGAEAIVS